MDTIFFLSSSNSLISFPTPVDRRNAMKTVGDRNGKLYNPIVANLKCYKIRGSTDINRVK